MNLSANMLGLDNAATPLGLKAMEALQKHNPRPDTATDSQIMFLVMNTSSVTLLPVTVMMYRAQQGAANPADVYLPLLMATTASTFVGVWLTARLQRIRLAHPVIMAVAAAWLGLLALGAAAALSMPGVEAARFSGIAGSVILLLVVATFIGAGLRARLNIYDTFIDGATEGFQMAVKLIPYLVAMLVMIAMLRACGALQLLLDGIRWLVALTGADSRFVDALPVALLKPLSGSGARAMMIEVMQTHGVDSLAGRMAAVMQGSTETTLYVLAVYFGSSGIVRIRYALWCGLAADFAGLCTAVLASYLFFG
jgi:spore maturation protein SpmB